MLRFLERHLSQVFFGFNGHGVRLAFGSLFIAAFFHWALLAFPNIKIIGLGWVCTTILLVPPFLSYGHMPCFAYIQTGIFVEQKFVLFFAGTLCNEPIKLRYEFNLIFFRVDQVIFLGIRRIPDHRFHLHAGCLAFFD
ncbi:hypothetical protein D3C84_913260 [compost metagenome]